MNFLLACSEAESPQGGGGATTGPGKAGGVCAERLESLGVCIEEEEGEGSL